MKSLNFESYLMSLEIKDGAEINPNKYPFSIPAITGLGTLEFHPKVTFLIGENGSGKSTIIEALAVLLGLNPEGGSKNFSFATRESHSILSKSLQLARSIKKPRDMFFLRAESVFNVATEIEKLDDPSLPGSPIGNYYGGKSLHEQSHGESFLAILLERFYGNGIYLLDEPESALSPTRQLSALRVIDDLVKKNSQFVICTHSPILMAYPDAWIYRLNQDGISKIDYQETENYQITKDFLDNPDYFLRNLFKD